jgi:Spy/CpxP family protein refolding chaperone
MKKNAFFALLTVLLPVSAMLAADRPPADPLGSAFFPPEAIMQAHERIGMGQEQLEAFRARIEKTQTSSEPLRQRLERETAALVALAKQEHVNEAALLAQLDKLLDAEREVKHLQIGMLAAIKNLLTPEQQVRLREITGGDGSKFAEEMRTRLEGKVTQIQGGMQKWAESGRDPSSIGQAMTEKVKPLLDAGKISEAEAEMDRLIEQLGKD